MTLRAPRLPFGLDPLIAEARQRARRRWALFAAAVFLVGGGATGGGFAAYLHHHRTNTGGPVAVLVAKKLLQTGTTGTGIRQGGLYVLRRIPGSGVDTGAIVDPAELPDKAVQFDVSPGQQLTAADFTPADYRSRSATNCPCPIGHVLVAIKRIPKGTAGRVIRTTPGYYKVTSILQRQMLTGAIVNPTTLAGKVALHDIVPGAQLTAADFGRATR